MANIGSWDKSQPSGASLVSDGDDLLRSHWSTLDAAWKEEHFFSGASTGIHKKGSGKAHVGTRSQVSSSGADDDGRIMWATDTNSLHLLGNSSHSTLVLGRNLGAKMWLGSNLVVGTSSTTTVAFQNSQWDEGGFVSASTTRLTIPSNATGRYQLVLNIQASSVEETEVSIFKNSAESVVFQETDVNESAFHYNLVGFDNAKPADFYEIIFRNNDGSNPKTLSAGTYLTHFSIQKLGVD